MTREGSGFSESMALMDPRAMEGEEHRGLVTPTLSKPILWRRSRSVTESQPVLFVTSPEARTGPGWAGDEGSGGSHPAPRFPGPPSGTMAHRMERAALVLELAR